jgi:hypothetical protein
LVENAGRFARDLAVQPPRCSRPILNSCCWTNPPARWISRTSFKSSTWYARPQPRRGLTTIEVLHDLNAAARFADRIMLLRAGTVIATGSPINVVTPSILQQAYGVNVSIIAGPDGYPVVIPPLAAPEQMRPSS